MRNSSGSFAKLAAVNLLVLAGAWLLAFALVQFARLASGEWFVSSIAILLAAAVGLYAALRFKAEFALLLFLGVIAWVATELAAHATWGIRAIQGGETHLTIMAAAMVGVALGAVTRRARKVANE